MVIYFQSCIFTLPTCSSLK